MTKHEFLLALEKELAGASIGERQAALQYYTEYLDEAGPEREEAVIKELGSPQSIAADILDTQSTRSEEEQWGPPNPPPPVGEALKTAGKSILHASEDLLQKVQNEFTTEAPKTPPPPPPPQYTAAAPVPPVTNQVPPPPPINSYNKTGNTIAKIILIVLACVLLSPILAGGFGTLFSVITAIVILFFCPIIIGVAFIISAIILIASGTTLFPTLVGSGVLVIGAGVFLLGIGLLSFYGGILLLFKALPRFCRYIWGGIVSIWNKIFHRSSNQEETINE